MPNVDIEVITTLPNRYASFAPDALEIEQHEQLKIRRIKLPYHQSGMIDQGKAFLYYAKKVFQLTHSSKYDLVFATSSRLMTAVLGSLVSKKKKIPLYLDIRDLFLDTIGEILPKKKLYLVRPFFHILEKLAFRQASRINLVSFGFKSYFDQKYQEKELRFFTNGIDDEFILLNEGLKKNPVHNKPLLVFYAGNIGEGQGLHLIIPSLAKQLEGKVNFQILGDGGKRKKLEEALKAQSCVNVEVLPPVNRDTLMQLYKGADILFLHLNNHVAFEKVLPSKLFEYAALGKPIWAGVSGYPAEFIKKEISNAAVFKPGNCDDAVRSLNTLVFETQNREHFIQKYARQRIMQEMSEDIKSLINSFKKIESTS